MNEEDLNVGSNAENPANTVTAKGVTDKISQYSGKVDGFIEKLVGVIGNHPWDAWLNVMNTYITKFIPVAIALAGALSCATGLVMLIKSDAPFSWVLRALCILIPVAFSMHLAPKALALTRSLIENGETVVIRPELVYVLKVLLGLGGLLLGVYLLLNFDSDLVVLAIVVIIFAVVMIICLERPAIVGVKAGYPVNCVEEVIALLMFPIRVIIALITPLSGIVAVGGIAYGVVQWFDDGPSAARTFVATAIIPFLLPLVVYLSYIALVLILDLYKAIVSIPRKLDELKTR